MAKGILLTCSDNQLAVTIAKEINTQNDIRVVAILSANDYLTQEKIDGVQ